MNEVKFKIGKKYVRGDRKGKRLTENIKLSSDSDIHNYLWDLTDSFEDSRCDYIVEWYKYM